MKTYIIFIILCFVFIDVKLLFPQNFEIQDCKNIQNDNQSPQSQTGGLYKPSQNSNGQYFRILIVFAEFSGDNNSYGNWQYGQFPDYASQIVDSNVSSSYRPMTLSDYWKTMSRGTFDIIGDVYPSVITLKSEEWYRSNSKYFQDANKDVLDSINEKLDFRKYDNWKLNNGSFVFNERNGDGYLDMVYIIYRSPDNSGYWFRGSNENFNAIAELGDNLTYKTSDNINIYGSWLISALGSGITFRSGAGTTHSRVLQLMSHELGHYLFGGGHSNFCGLMTVGPNERLFALNGWEREKLGYVAYTSAYQDNFTMTLGDFMTTGDILKIPISGSTDKYFLVENHQRLNKYDQIMTGHSLNGNFDTTTTLGSGIYVWLIRNADYFTTVSVDIKAANGNWDWAFVDKVNIPGWYSDGVVPVSGRVAVDRNFGKSDRYYHNIQYNNKWYEKWHDTIPPSSQLELSRNIFGIENHAFNYNYNRLFTPWSSPSTYVDGVTNIAMQVYSQNGNDITIKVFNTAGSCATLPPSKPQFLHSSISSLHNPIISWTPNIEPTLIYYKIYRSTNSGQSWQYVGQSSGTNPIYTDTTETYCKTSVQYRVSAVTTSSSSESIQSDPISAKADLMTEPLHVGSTQIRYISGICNLNMDIEVDSGGKLYILPGARLSFTDNAGMTVEGILNAIGSSTNRIVLQLEGYSGNWSALTFYGSGASNSILQHVLIDSNIGIECISGANIIIENCDLDNSNEGIYVYSSEPQIISNNIYDPQTNGIFGEASGMSMYIYGNSIVKETDPYNYQGVFLSNNSNATLWQNYITGFYWGAYIGGGSTMSTAGDPFVCNNRITGNSRGIGTGWGSSSDLGDDDSWGSGSSIFSNSIDVYTYKESAYSSFYDYYGTNPQIITDTSSWSEFEYMLPTDPCASSENNVNNNVLLKQKLNKSAKNKFGDGLKLEKNNKIDEAIEFYKSLINKDNFVRQSLTRLALIKNKYSRSEITTFLESLLSCQSKHYGKIKRLLGDIYLQGNRFDDAILAYNDVINNSLTDYDAISAKFEKLFGYLHVKKNISFASQILSELKNMKLTDPEHLTRIQIAEYLISRTSSKIYKYNKEQDYIVPVNYSLFQNYPNPFNPNTTISYALPKPGNVTLKVYDILGKEIACLVNDYKVEGNYNVTFNASRLASGVYIYQLRANDIIISKKMVLTK